MFGSLLKIALWLRRRAENVAALLIATVFITFILQIVFRYVLGLPVGWTLEVSTLAWMWAVLWGSAFVVSERDEIRFDILYSVVSPWWRRIFTVLTSLATVIIFSISLPAVIDYVTFMKVERSSYINIRLDYLFSVYIFFAVAAIIRYLWLGFMALKNAPLGSTEPSKSGKE